MRKILFSKRTLLITVSFFLVSMIQLQAVPWTADNQQETDRSQTHLTSWNTDTQMSFYVPGESGSLFAVPTFELKLDENFSTGFAPEVDCLNSSSYGSGAAPTEGCLSVALSSCNFAGEYATMSAAVAGTSYTFKSSVSTDYLTIRQGTYDGAIIGQGTTPVTVTATAGGNLYMHINSDSSCGTQSSCRATSVTCASCTPPTDYCAVTSTNTTYGIANVTTTNGIDNFNNTTGSGTYSDYTAMFASQEAGGTVDFSVSPVVTASSHGYGVWIDWENNNCFIDAGNVIALTTAYFTGTYTGTITVPSGTPAGDYRMRVVNNYISSSPSPCGNLGSAAYGEAEDYTFRVVEVQEPGCLFSSAYGNATAPTDVCNPLKQITSCNYAGEYATITAVVAGNEYQFASSIATDYLTIRQGTFDGPVVGEGITPLTITAATADNLYMHIAADADCNTQSSCRATSVEVMNLPPVTDYCLVTSTNTNYGIDGVETTGGVDNISNLGTGPGQYTDFTAQFVSQVEGGSIDFTLTGVNSSQGYGIWVDWSGSDFCWADATHHVFTSNAYQDGASGTITVPAGTPAGDYRMRIVGNWLSSNPLPCGGLGSAGYGEAEDYTFRVVEEGTGSDCDIDFAHSNVDGTGNTQTLLFADDFEVGSGVTMSIDKVTLRTFNNIGVLTTLSFFEDNGGQPAATPVATYSNLTPDSQTIIDNNYGMNIYGVEVSLPTPAVLAEGIYWIAFQNTVGTDNGTNYWVITNAGFGAPGKYSTDGGVTWTTNSSNYNYSFKVDGECDGGGGPGGDCPIEYTGDFVDGLGDLTGGIILAADFPVPAGETWEVSTVKLQMIGLTDTVEVSIYQDGGGQPGTQVLAPTVLTPVSAEIIGNTAAGSSIFELELDLSGLISLDGGASGALYWVAATTAGPEGNYWHYTETVNNGTNFWYSVDNYGSWADTGPVGFPVDGAFSICVEEGGEPGIDCDQGDDSNAFENGFQISAGSTYRNADDFFVSAGNTLNVQQIEINVFSMADFTTMNFNFYEDDGGVPGSTIVYSLTDVPVETVAIGANFGYTVYATFAAVDLDFTEGHYWMQPEANNGGQNAFWEITTLGSLGDPIANSNAGGAWTPDPDSSQGVFKLHCEPVTPPDEQCLFDITSSIEPISRVILSDIDNSSDPTINGSPALEDFTSIIGHLAPGGSYSVALEGNTGGSWTNYFTLWIDFDQSGTYENSEMFEIGSIANSTGTDGQQAVNTIVIPTDALMGSTTMRVIKNFNNSPTNPCGQYSFGQGEDYGIEIEELLDCAGTPEGGTVTVNPDHGNPGSTYTVSSSGYSFGNGLTYQWQSNTAAAGWVNEGAATSSYASYVATAPSGLGTEVEWRLEVTCTLSGETALSTTDIFTVELVYCDPEVSIVEPITRVDFADIDNSSDPNSTIGYEDFTSIIGNVNQASSYDIALEGNTAGNYTNYFTVWVDWNYNGTFEVTEMYEIGSITNSTGTDGQQAIGNITVPTDAVIGLTRMRVIKNYASSPTDPCGSYTFGQIEDYTINVGSLGTGDIGSYDFTYYPNPVKDVLNISSQKNIETVSVFNMAGQQVINNAVVNNGKVDMSTLSPGAYVFRVKLEGNATKTFKVIKK